jgi:hypothetical protein
MSTPFWFNDISILFNKNYLLEIIPLKSYDFNRKLNAILRFTIYYAILLYILKNDKNVLCLPFITIVITVFLNKTNKSERQGKAMVDSKNVGDDHDSKTVNKMVGEIDDSIFRKPDVDNPMMNMNVFDLYDDKRAIPTYDNPGVERIVEEKWSDGLYTDSDDLFGRNNSQRQWYTMPNSKSMNRQTEFAKWCYMTPPTCKEGNGLQCANNLHPRLNRNSGDAPPPSS